VFDLSLTLQTRDGRVARHELHLLSPPDQWAVEDAREALWAIQRALGHCALYSLRLVEVEVGQTHRLEVETSLGTAVTPALRLSSMALVWLQGAAFELPRHPRAH
jgi:hypothetical protein